MLAHTACNKLEKCGTPVGLAISGGGGGGVNQHLESGNRGPKNLEWELKPKKSGIWELRKYLGSRIWGLRHIFLT